MAQASPFIMQMTKTKGSMDEDKWISGIFFDVEKEHFIGDFKENTPWNGDWYKHVKVQTIVNGK